MIKNTVIQPGTRIQQWKVLGRNKQDGQCMYNVMMRPFMQPLLQ